MTLDDIKGMNRLWDIVSKCQFEDWTLYVGREAMGGRPYLQVRFVAPCNTTGEIKPQHGRKWFLSYHMSKSEVVQTAFKAVLTAMEHEVREKFLYRGAAIFCPHFNVDHLVELCGRSDALDGREEAA